MEKTLRVNAINKFKREIELEHQTLQLALDLMAISDSPNNDEKDIERVKDSCVKIARLIKNLESLLS